MTKKADSFLYMTRKMLIKVTNNTVNVSIKSETRSRNHFAVETAMHSVYVVVVTVIYIKILSVAQQCFCCKFKSLAAKQIFKSSFEKKYIPKINCVNFWVFPQRLVYIGRRFGTLCQVHLQRLEVSAFRYRSGWSSSGSVHEGNSSSASRPMWQSDRCEVMSPQKAKQQVTTEGVVTRSRAKSLEIYYAKEREVQTRKSKRSNCVLEDVTNVLGSKITSQNIKKSQKTVTALKTVRTNKGTVTAVAVPSKSTVVQPAQKTESKITSQNINTSSL
jgi:hypothetical protein